jgi:hypothetical protein
MKVGFQAARKHQEMFGKGHFFAFAMVVIPPRIDLYPDPTPSPETPIHPAARRHHAGYVFADFLFQRRRPGDELKAEAVVDYGEAAGGERDALAVDAGDGFPFSGCVAREASLGRDARASYIELAPA